MTSERNREGREPGLTYRDAGVDIDVKEAALREIARLVATTRTPGTLSELGSFGGLFELETAGGSSSVLVASADGVGTKLRVAFLTGIHDTVGRDLVNHCVNDILVQGARPLFFLDYVATGRLDPQVLVQLVRGVARGCRENRCALLGGETAEMPGFYADGEYDVAGFIIGRVERQRLLDGSRIAPGDRILGLPSAGLHTNGYSLARKIFFEIAGLEPDSRVKDLGTTVGEALLAEHRSYLPLLELPLARQWIRGLAHVTGGGITDNLPRILPPGCAARIRPGSWSVPPIFAYLQREGRIATPEMFRTFNMGIGMLVVLAAEQVGLFDAHLRELGEVGLHIGEVVPGEGSVEYV